MSPTNFPGSKDSFARPDGTIAPYAYHNHAFDAIEAIEEVLLHVSEPPPVLNVSPTGQDSWPGGEFTPKQTVAAAMAAAVDGSTILVRGDGTYDVPASLVLRNRLHVRGIGRPTLRLTGQVNLFTATNVRDWLLEDLDLDLNKGGTANAGSLFNQLGLYALATTAGGCSGTVRRVRVRDGHQKGLHGQGNLRTHVIASASMTGRYATYTTSAAHDLIEGERVTVYGVNVAGYNGHFIVESIPSSTTFQVPIGTSGLGAGTGGTVAARHPLTVTVEDVEAYNMGHAGLWIVGGSRCQVMRGEFHNNAENGVALLAGAWNVVNAAKAYKNVKHGIVTGVGGEMGEFFPVYQACHAWENGTDTVGSLGYGMTFGEQCFGGVMLGSISEGNYQGGYAIDIKRSGDPAGTQRPGRFRLIGIVARDNGGANGNHGTFISHAIGGELLGSVFEGNKDQGVFLGGRAWTVHGNDFRNNGGFGLSMGDLGGTPTPPTGYHRVGGNHYEGNASGAVNEGPQAAGTIVYDGVLRKAGPPADTNFLQTPHNGQQAIDTTNNRIYVRIGGAWKSVAVA